MRAAMNLWTASFVALATTLAIPAAAQLVPGGHNETSENLPLTWSTSVPTPGVTGGGGGGGHLLISEVVVTPTAGEYIEICNSTLEPINLSGYYLSDDWYTGAPSSCYCKLSAGGYVVAVNSDFTARFPLGTIISPGQVFVIACDGAGFATTYPGKTADFELNPTSTAADMIVVSNNTPLSLALLTNTSEMVVLFYWDGLSDNVCDMDYVQWGSLASGNGVDKTAIAVDGPDADAVATQYKPDTAPASQTFVAAPAGGSSTARAQCQESAEAAAGNGCIDRVTPARRNTWGRLKLLYR